MEKKQFLQKVEEAKEQMQTLLVGKSKKPEVMKASAVNPMEPNPFPIAPGGPGLAPPPGAAANAVDLMVKHDPRSIVGKYARAQEECERLPTEIAMARGRLKEIEGKINALK